MALDAAMIRERDLALALHETFMASGSEDVLSPRFQDVLSPRLQAMDLRGSSEAATRLLGADDQRRQQWGQELSEAYFRKLKETEFGAHERGVARLNHGSFGSCPKSVLKVQAEWVERWLRQPDAFALEGLEAGLLEARRVVASHVNCTVEELVLVDNATTSASIVALDVMWAFAEGRYQQGDSILMLDTAYRAITAAFEAYAARAGANLLVVKIPFPVSSPAQILAAVEEELRKARIEGKIIRMAVMDHITSMPSIVLPLKDLVAMCRRFGVEQIFVDGAQAIGNLDIDVKEIDCDYYISNLNKWMFCPTSSSLLYCKEQHLSRLHHPIISSMYGQGLAAECNWVGTRDYSPLLAVPAGFEFAASIPGGLKAIRAYNHDRITAVGKMLAEAWSTHCGVAPEMVASMVMVAVPPALHILTDEDAGALKARLRHDFGIEVHTCVLHTKEGDNEGITSYLRISHQLYNTWDEYLRLRDVIKDLVKNSKP